MREIRVHGQERRYHHTRVGLGGRMDTLQCAIVLAKLEKFDWEVERRAQLGNQYLKLLEGVPEVDAAVVRPDRTSVWGQFTIKVSNREEVLRRLKESGIPTSVYYPVPLHQQPAYEASCRISGDLKICEMLADRVLSLPMHPYLDMVTQTRIIDALSKAVA
jgi:UDP-2-acetamido-2-deoxy-ribo-hexuluronate aminotransferase